MVRSYDDTSINVERSGQESRDLTAMVIGSEPLLRAQMEEHFQ